MKPAALFKTEVKASRLYSDDEKPHQLDLEVAKGFINQQHFEIRFDRGGQDPIVMRETEPGLYFIIGDKKYFVSARDLLEALA